MNVGEMDERSGLHDVLAEILTCKKVGITHVRLVGKVIIADANLNSWFLRRKSAPAEKPMPLKRYTEELLRDVARLESFIDLWGRLNPADDGKIGAEGLRELEAALEALASDYERELQVIIAEFGA
jgi:hypothetical protein